MNILDCGTMRVVQRTPAGWIGVAARAEGLYRIILPLKTRKAVLRELRDAAPGPGSAKCGAAGGRFRRGEGDERAAALAARAIKSLARYFAGMPVSFDLPLDLRYYTPFRKKVWREAARIPYGRTRSYAWLARKAGNPRAARAVGQAMGANPLPIIIP